ncbi:MAG: hypothetical protein K6F31_11965 [Acetatifactor sp.]|nr:hypothetical protein [Acetatifactor sp.]
MEQTQDYELNRDFKMGSIFLYALPTMITYLFNGFYSTVDGAFIEKFQGPYAIAAVNLYYPILNLVLAIGSMIGTGGGVALAALLGEKKEKEANRLFSQLVMIGLVIGLVIAILGNVFSDGILRLLGATAGNVEYAAKYYRIMVTTSPILLFAALLVPFFLAEGKTTSIAVTSILGGVMNIVLDYLFMGPLKLGISGAAAATMIGYSLPCLYGLYFYMPGNKNGSHFRFAFVRIELKKVALALCNGSSEMVSNLASGVTALVMNHLAYRFYNEAGVSVVSVFLYVQFMVMAVFLGLTAATEPLMSYNYGEKNFARGKKIFNLSLAWTLLLSALACILLALLYKPVVAIFFSPMGETLAFYELGCRSLLFAVPACLLMGFNIFISGFFTAYLNGAVSAFLSVLRTLVFLVLCMFALAYVMGGDGLWLSWAAAEFLSLFASIFFLQKYKKRYLDGKRASGDGSF